jgi:thiamine transport system permease protein
VLYFFAALLLSPYFMLLSKFPDIQVPNYSEVIWATKNSIIQASFSALGSLVLGFFLAKGSIAVDRRFPRLRTATEILCLFPSLLPPIFILMTVASFLHPFVVGLQGVILIHVLMNAGMVAMLLKSLAENKLQKYMELAVVSGSSQWHFIKNIWGLVQKDIFAIFLFVFVVCFCSFAVPIVVGGGRATTLEILIYEKIRISGAWGEALGLAFLQMFIVSIIVFFQNSERSALVESGRKSTMAFLGGKFSIISFWLYSLGFIVLFIYQSMSGWPQLLSIPGLWEKAVETIPLSLLLAFTTGALILALLLLAAVVTPNRKLNHFLSGMLSPSTALLGFAFLFFGSNEEPWIYFKFVLGFALLIFTTLYRWGWQQALSGLEKQIEVAIALGSSRWMLFSEILFPQLIGPATKIAAIGGIWALGDFSLGKILIAQDVTLALLTETLMSSYRTEAAMALLSVLMVFSGLIYLLFWGLGYVARRKFT